MAAGVGDTESAIAAQIREITSQYVGPEGRQDTREFKLIFTFDDREFSTVFKFKNNGISNGCIDIDINYESSETAYDIASYIRKNTPERACFSPTLSPETLPPGVSQTDVLQVMMSKLKFMYLGQTIISLEDHAKLVNPKTGEVYKTFISQYRLLRDEPTLYEKYGYKSAPFNRVRDVVRKTKWGDISHYIIPRTGKTLEDMWAQTFGYGVHYEDDSNDEGEEIGLPNPEDTIPTVMRRLTLDNVEESVTRVPHYHKEADEQAHRNRMRAAGFNEDRFEYTEEKTIVVLIFNALAALKGLMFPSRTLRLHKTSPIWQAWDARLQFRSLEEARALGGARRSRRTRRRSHKL